MNKVGDFMFTLLLIFLVIIGGVCYFEAKNVSRKGVKFLLSLTVAVILSLIMEVTLESSVGFYLFGETFFTLIYFVIPITAFLTFQLLLYDLKLNRQ